MTITRTSAGGRRMRAVIAVATLLAASCSGAAPKPETARRASVAAEAPATAPGDAEPSAASPPTAAPSPSASLPPTSSPTVPPSHELKASPAVPRPVRIAFVGDVHGEPPIAGVLRDGGNPLDGMAAALMDADIAVANVETAVGSSGAPADKDYVFQASPALLDALADAGVDVISLANNHALDFGRDALAETIELAAAADLRVVGAGADAAEAYAPAVIDVDGRQVAIVGLTRVIPEAHWAAGPSSPGMAAAYAIEAAAKAVRAAAGQADHVVVTIHWGQERNPCPVDHQLALVDALIGAGADVIAGHHPHVLQGIERRGASLIAYSLGNFVFYGRPGDGRATGALTVTLDDDGASDWVFSPAEIDDRGSPQPLEGVDADRVLDTLAERSPGGACRFS